MALQCDIQLPISAVKDFRFLIQQTIAEAKKVSIQAANYGFIVSGNENPSPQRWVVECHIAEPLCGSMVAN